MRTGFKTIIERNKSKISSQSQLKLSPLQKKILEPIGLLVLLAGSISDGRDLVIAAARRRYSNDTMLEFPSRISTRANAHDGEHIDVARSVFHFIEAHRGFAVSWKRDDVFHGLTAGSLTALETGRIVVLAVDYDAIAQFREIWPRIEIIQMASDLDGARPHSRVWRSSCYSATQSPSLSHSLDMAEAVRNFLHLLDGLRKQHVVSCSQ